MSVFHFKHFSVQQENSSMKVGTDSMLLGSLTNANDPLRILDIGAGTGVLALMMAQKFPKSAITAVELDELAAVDCEWNFTQSKYSDRLTLVWSDLFEFDPSEKFDLIISNPPFFENSLKNLEKSKTLARHTDSLPLDKLIEKVSALLSHSGAFWVILPLENAEKLIEMGKHSGLYCCSRIDIEGKPASPIRAVIELKFGEPDQGKSCRICIRDSEGSYTEEYRVLTRDFHNRSV